MVEISTNSKKVVRTINILTEVNVVNFINVTLVHVSAEDLSGYVFGSLNSQEVEYSKELHFGDMTVFSNIEILEARLEVHASLHDGISVLVNNISNINVSLSRSQVLSAGKDGVFVRVSSNSSERSLINSRNSESLVDASAEVNVVEENLRIVSFVFISESFKFIFSQSKVHSG